MFYHTVIENKKFVSFKMLNLDFYNCGRPDSGTNDENKMLIKNQSTIFSVGIARNK